MEVVYFPLVWWNSQWYLPAVWANAGGFMPFFAGARQRGQHALCWLKTVSCVNQRTSLALVDHGTKLQASLLPNLGSFWRFKYVLVI